MANGNGLQAIPQVPREDEQVHLRDYIKVLSRRRSTLIITFLVIFLGTALWTFGTTPVYQAETLLRVKAASRSQGILGELAAVTQANPVETEIEVLKTHSLAREVVRNLGLDLSLTPAGNGWFHRILVSVGLAEENKDLPLPDTVSLEVPKELEGKPLSLRFATDGLGYRLSFRKEFLLEGRVGEAAAGRGVRMTIQSKSPMPGGDELRVTKRDSAVVTEALTKRMNVAQVGRNTEIIRLTYQDTDPLRAARVLEAFNRLYVEKDIADKSKEATATLEFIREQVGLSKERLDKAQSAINEYKVKTGAVALSQEAQLLVQRISDLEVEQARLSVTRTGLQQVSRAIQDEATLNPAGIGALGITSLELASLMTGYLTLSQKRADLVKDYTPENPLVDGLDAQIALAAEQIRTTAGAILGATITREKAVKEVLGVYRVQLARLPEIEQELARLEKDVLIQEKTYSFLLEKDQDVQIERASTISNIRLVDPPMAPNVPVRPKKTQNLVLGFLLGLLLGIGISFFVEYLDDTVKDVEDIERRIRISAPIYGTTPFVREAHERRLRKEPHLVIEQKQSVVSEAFRTLRTNILLSRTDMPPKVITMTSPGMGEGKTFVAVNLAAVSALTGKRTLVIDCDLRKPQMHVVFGLENQYGLSNLLSGQMELQQVLRRTSVEHLDTITSGPVPPNPSEMLGSARMSELLERLKKEYDLIVLDTPPVTLVADPLLLSRMSELTLLVVRSEITPVEALKGALEQLEAVQVGTSGLVLNAMSLHRQGRYGYRSGYRYGYGYGYGEGQERMGR